MIYFGAQRGGCRSVSVFEYLVIIGAPYSDTCKGRINYKDNMENIREEEIFKGGYGWLVLNNK